MKRNEIDLPLYAFFDILRKNGFALGISEYNTLLDALELGFGRNPEKGVLDKNEILKVCKTLWLNPNQSKHLFEQLFYENFQHFSEKIDKKEKDNERDNIDGGGDRNGSGGGSDDIDGGGDGSGNGGGSGDIDGGDDGSGSGDIGENSENIALPYVKIVFNNRTGGVTTIDDKKVTSTRKFSFSDYYFDISKRQMQQATRFLPSFQPSLSANEIDIEASIEKFAQVGTISKPVFKRRERITNNVLLLIDSKGSMLAFEKLISVFSEALKDSFKAHKVGNKNKVAQYYFYNVVHDFCYKNTAHSQYEKTAKIINRLNPKYSNIIIISDAGAARGGNSDGRFKETLQFVFKFKRVAHKMVWLNPLPEERWKGTTAERIARFIPMFSLNSQHNLQCAVEVLRGK